MFLHCRKFRLFQTKNYTFWVTFSKISPPFWDTPPRPRMTVEQGFFIQNDSQIRGGEKSPGIVGRLYFPAVYIDRLESIKKIRSFFLLRNGGKEERRNKYYRSRKKSRHMRMLVRIAVFFPFMVNKSCQKCTFEQKKQ